MRKNKNIFILILFLPFFLNAGEVVDSLFKATKQLNPLKKCESLLDYLDDNWKNKPQESEIIAKEILKISKRNKLSKKQAEAYSYLGMLAKNQAKYKVAEKYYDKAAEISQKNGDREYLANILNNRAILFSEKGDYSNAIKKYKESLEIYQNSGNNKKVADLYFNLSGTYRKLGKYDTALDYAFKSLKYSEEHGEEKGGLGSSYDNIAIIYHYLKNDDKALFYFEKGLKLRKEANNLHGIASSYNNLALIYKLAKNYTKVEEYLFKSLEIKKKLVYKTGIANTMNNIGSFYQEIGKWDLAEKYFQQSLELKRKINNKADIISTLVNMANFYAEKKNFKLSEEYILDASKMAQSNKLRLLLSEVYHSASINYSLAEKYKKAFEYSQKYLTLKDSLLAEENQKKIAELQVQYETEKKEKQIEVLTKEKNMQLTIRNFLMLIVFIAVILLIVIYKLFRVKKRENKQRLENEEKIKELNRTLEERVKNGISKLKKQQFLLMQKSKLESLGRLSAGIAHEINQPVARISLGLDNILIRQSMKKLDETYLSNKCKVLFSDINRIRLIIEHVRTFSREQNNPKLEKINPNVVLNNALMLVKTQYKNHSVKLIKDLAKEIGFALGNSFRLEQVIMNMLSNAKDAVEERMKKDNNYSEKKITVKSYRKNEYIYIEITDNGIGIKEDIINNIFDPFFTTKSAEKGTGLGLSISYGVIKEMHGNIEVESKVGEFTTMRIVLPEHKRGK